MQGDGENKDGQVIAGEGPGHTSAPDEDQQGSGDEQVKGEHDPFGAAAFWHEGAEPEQKTGDRADHEQERSDHTEDWIEDADQGFVTRFAVPPASKQDTGAAVEHDQHPTGKIEDGDVEDIGGGGRDQPVPTRGSNAADSEDLTDGQRIERKILQHAEEADDQRFCPGGQRGLFEEPQSGDHDADFDEGHRGGDESDHHQ